MVLLKRGVRTSWLRGVMPLKPMAGRVVGPAFTIRFVQQRVAQGASVVGLYPSDQGTLADYQRWLAAGEP
jgi:regulator of RNase E activity RraA